MNETVRLICVRPCQVPGFGIVRQDAVIELPQSEVDARIRACFKSADGDEAVTAKKSAGLEGLPKEALYQRAEALGLPVSSRTTKAELLTLIQAAENASVRRA